jgi:hypothetical protein
LQISGSSQATIVVNVRSAVEDIGSARDKNTEAEKTAESWPEKLNYSLQRKY